MKTTTVKSRENRLRRMARQRGLEMQKSRTRNPRAVDFETYMLIDPETNFVAALGLRGGYGLSLDEVESALAEQPNQS